MRQTPEKHRLDGPRQIQPQHQLQLGNRSDQIALMHAARLVVDIEHAAADHHRHIHGQRHGAREQILHVLDIRVKLDDLERDRLARP